MIASSADTIPAAAEFSSALKSTLKGASSHGWKQEMAVEKQIQVVSEVINKYYLYAGVFRVCATICFNIAYLWPLKQLLHESKLLLVTCSHIIMEARAKLFLPYCSNKQVLMQAVQTLQKTLVKQNCIPGPAVKDLQGLSSQISFLCTQFCAK